MSDLVESSLTFYDCPTAPSPRRARLFLAEKGVEYSVMNIDLAKGEHLADPYRQVNPRCTVPALALSDGTVLAENAGIFAYLEAAYPDPPLLGRTAAEKGLIAMWNAIIEFDGLSAVAEALRNSTPAMAQRAVTGPDNHAQIPALAERGLSRAHAFFKRLDAHLATQEYVVGDAFSNADITALVVTDFARIIRIKPTEQFEHIKRWRAQLSERPSLKAE